jgi:hypothetical protein
MSFRSAVLCVEVFFCVEAGFSPPVSRKTHRGLKPAATQKHLARGYGERNDTAMPLREPPAHLKSMKNR